MDKYTQDKIDKLFIMVCEKNNENYLNVLSNLNSRKQRFGKPRREFAWLIKEHSKFINVKLTNKAIGLIIKKSSANVYTAIKVVKDDMSISTSYNNEMESLKNDAINELNFRCKSVKRKYTEDEIMGHIELNFGWQHCEIFQTYIKDL